MQPSPSEQLVATLYDKAIAAGLTKVTVEASTDNLINHKKVGKNSRSYAKVSCKGSDEQEAAFKASLEGAESENLEVERMGPSAGDDCPPIKVFATATGEEKNYAWAQDDPKVYLFDFWATSVGPFLNPMAHNPELLAHNSNWEGHVEIVAISLDDNKDTAQKQIEEKGWTLVSSCWGGEGGSKSDTSMLFKVDKIPTCLLVKKGKILWRGHPYERDLAVDIKHLIANDDLPAGQAEGEAAVPRVLQGEELQQGLAQVEKIFADFLAANPAQTSPFFVHINKTKKTADGVKLSARVFSGGSYHHKQKGVIESIGEQIKQLFPGVELRLGFLDPIPEIARGDKCVLCNKALSEADIQYLCPYCEPKHYHCQECEDLPREGVGSAKLAHPHTLYKITPLSSHFDELWSGSDIPQDEIKTEDPADRVHDCRCNNQNSPGGCDGKVEGIRYKCGHCRGFDLCEACEKLFWDTASEEMKATMKGMGHFEHHVLLKIPFP